MRQVASNQWPFRTSKKRKALKMSQWLIVGWKTSPLCLNKRGSCRNSTKGTKISLRWGWLTKFLHSDPHQDRRQDIPPSGIGLVNSKIYRTQFNTTGRTLSPAQSRNLISSTKKLAIPQTTLNSSSRKRRLQSSGAYPVDLKCTNRLWETAVWAAPNFVSPKKDSQMPNLHLPSAKRTQPLTNERYANS